MPPRIPLLLGTMTFGAHGKNGVRTAELASCQNILDVFLDKGHREIDTARQYAEGTTEEYLSKLDLKGATVDTKVYPVSPGDHKPAALRATFEKSLQALAPLRVRILYLHAPDRSVPWEETLREVNTLYQEGKFEIFGLSNYASWEVAEIAMICKTNGWIQPKIYQGMYNAITRDCETELVPCLRKFGMRLVVYNPLAGGFFAGKVSKEQTPPGEGRFSGDSNMAKMYRTRYVQQGYFDALEVLKPVAAEHNLRLTEIALRWCQHHSVLSPQDGIILGASSVVQMVQNCEDSEKGPLPQAVLDCLDAAWLKVKATSPLYWR